jgi:ATP-dependent DNA ligase
VLLQANSRSRASSIDTPARRGFAGASPRVAHVAAYLPGAHLGARRRRLHPTLQAFTRRPSAGPSWLHEVKHDGYRIVACKQGERVTLWARYGADFIDRLRTIAWRGSCRSAAAASI